MRPVSLDARRLGLRLGLGDLNEPAPCHGFANTCICVRCFERSKRLEELREVA